METSNEKLLITPVPKSKTSKKPEYPFPIIRSDCNEGEEDPNWKCAVGYLQDNCVLVHDEEDIKLLYTRGFYGKGTLSKNTPRICLEKQSDKDDTEAVAGPSVEKSEDIIDIADDEEEEKKETAEAKSEKSEEIEIVLSDSSNSVPEKKIPVDSSNSVPAKKVLPKPSSDEKESLQLTFEEAYFLSYALGCLVVKDNKDQPMHLTRLWNKFCMSTKDAIFPIMYTAYHHFRSKGWVVKSGIKYGTDYILYKDGPPFYHATYAVLVKPVKELNLRDVRGGRQLTWSSLLALNRVNSSVSKGLLFLYVITPCEISESKVSTPFCISQYKVEEVLFQRWVAAENREETD